MPSTLSLPPALALSWRPCTVHPKDSTNLFPIDPFVCFLYLDKNMLIDVFRILPKYLVNLLESET